VGLKIIPLSQPSTYDPVHPAEQNFDNLLFKYEMPIDRRQGRIQKFFEGGVLKYFCMEGKI